MIIGMLSIPMNMYLFPKLSGFRGSTIQGGKISGEHNWTTTLGSKQLQAIPFTKQPKNYKIDKFLKQLLVIHLKKVILKR